MLVVSRKLRCVARTTGASAESSLTPLAPDRPRLLCVHQVLPLCPPDGPDPAYCGRPAAGHQEQRPRRQRSLLARPPLGLPAACHRLRESSTSPRSTAAAPRSRAKLTRSSRSCASNYSSCTSRKHPFSAKPFSTSSHLHVRCKHTSSRLSVTSAVASGAALPRPLHRIPLLA
jgi:hypothetical protein